MTHRWHGLAAGLLLVACVAAGNDSVDQVLVIDPAIDCNFCAEWNQPHPPFRIYGNTYYVGMAGVSAVLVDGGSELALIDGGLPQSVEPILANIRALGFDPARISLILLSHAHYDHVGGVNAIQRYTGARVLTSAAAAKSLRRGDLMPDDPQYDQPFKGRSFPAVSNVLAVDGGAEFEVGDSPVRGIFTPGHTPGGMSWTWQACEEGRCLDVVYADSIGPVSVGSYRFTEGLGDEIEKSAKTIADLDCDILLGTHPFVFDMQEKYKQGRGAFVDASACKAYAKASLRNLEKRLNKEQAKP